MKITDILGSNYREDMTTAELIDAIEKVNLVPKNVMDKIASELADAKKQTKAAQGEKATVESRLAEIESKLAAAERTNNIAAYEKQLLGIGYDATLANTAATAIVDGDMATFLTKQAEFMQAHDKAIKTQQMQGTPAPAGGTSTTITKEQFSKMSLSERAKLAETDRATYDAMANA